MTHDEFPKTPKHPEISTHEYDAINRGVYSGVKRLTGRVPGAATIRRWADNDTGGHDISQWARLHPEEFPGYTLEKIPTSFDRIKSVGGKVIVFARDVVGTIKEELIVPKNPK